MTRKDYIAIAAALKLARSVNPSSKGHNAGVYDAARLLAETLAADNARFDRVRFLTACGVEG